MRETLANSSKCIVTRQ